MSAETFTQTLIVIGRGADQWVATVSCGADAACKTIDETLKAFENDVAVRWAHFTSPSANGRVPSRPIRIPADALYAVTAVFEQEVTIQNDPRAFGQSRTPGGLMLPS
jgi:hypothetical protein